MLERPETKRRRPSVVIACSCSCWALLALGCSSKGETELPMPMAGAGTGAAATTAMPVIGSMGGAGGMAGGAVSPAGGSGSGGSAGAMMMMGEAGAAGGAGNADAGMEPPADAGSAGDPGPRGTGPGDWVAGDYPPDLMAEEYLEISGVPGQGENVRQYKVHVPPSYDPMVPTPLVFCIHGLGQTAVLFCVVGAAMHETSDANGFIMVMPNGYQNSWNAGTCCGGASTERLDDVALFRKIFEEVGKHVNVDLDRVYATGLSNGGYMSYRLACEAADIFTAVAPGAAAIGINSIGGGTNPDSDFTECKPSRPISVLDMHGTADPLVPYSLAAPTMMHMAEQDGCGTTTHAAEQPASGGDTSCVSYDGCPAGIELTACRVEEGGHCWFGGPDCGTGGGDIGLAIVGNNSDTLKNNAAAWGFFERISR